MGAKVTKEEINCFNEIRFILVAFKNKYEGSAKVPRYGLENILMNLNKKDKNTWKSLKQFNHTLFTWRCDTQFIIAMEKIKGENISILESFILDTMALENKIHDIINKNINSDKNRNKIVNK